MHWLAVSSVCFNPFAYCWLNSSFRDTLRVTCRQCCAVFRRRHWRRRPGLQSPLVSAGDDRAVISPALAAAVRYDRIGQSSDAVERHLRIVAIHDTNPNTNHDSTATRLRLDRRSTPIRPPQLRENSRPKRRIENTANWFSHVCRKVPQNHYLIGTW